MISIIPFSKMQINSSGFIEKIGANSGENATAIRQRLLGLGFLPGMEISLSQKNYGNYVAKIGSNTRVIINEKIADSILVSQDKINLSSSVTKKKQNLFSKIVSFFKSK